MAKMNLRQGFENLFNVYYSKFVTVNLIFKVRFSLRYDYIEERKFISLIRLFLVQLGSIQIRSYSVLYNTIQLVQLLNDGQMSELCFFLSS